MKPKKPTLSDIMFFVDNCFDYGRWYTTAKSPDSSENPDFYRTQYEKTADEIKRMIRAYKKG